MSLHSLMTVLHELVFSCENVICTTLLKHYDTNVIYKMNYKIRYALSFIIVYNKIRTIEKSNLLVI